MRRRFGSGVIETEHGSTHQSKTLQESLDYIEAQFSDYLTYTGLGEAQLTGKIILELGFGDNVGVALMFVAAGAAKIVCVDKFYSRRDRDYERAIYVALREKLDVVQRERFDAAVDLTAGINFNPDKLRILNGMDLQRAATTLANETLAFDLIISRAVVEEMFDPKLVFSAADQLLKPDGVSVHKIDLSDYGIFSDAGMHPLTFLTIPDRVYRLMSTDSGIPNRKLIGYYRRVMSELGYAAKFFITGIVGLPPIVPHKERIQQDVDYAQDTLELIEQIRPQLKRPFREMTSEELMINGIFMVAQKPGEISQQLA